MPHSHRKNLHDIKILSNLRKNPSIIITKVDKSNSLVVMDTTDYDNKILSYLKDTTTYKQELKVYMALVMRLEEQRAHMA